MTAPLPLTADSAWHWQIPPEAGFKINGALDRNSLGGGGPAMMYPGGTALVFLAAVMTHAAMGSASAKAEQERIQTNADKVLEPFRDILATVTLPTISKKLADRWPRLGERRADGPVPQSRWAVEFTPAFTLAQDARTLAADVTFLFWDHPKDAQPRATRVVRVVSNPITDSKPEEVWRAANGARLHATIEGLLAESLDIALADAVVDTSLPMKTIRYSLGSGEQIERGNLVNAECGRVLIRNLRGWLLSLPLPSSDESTAAKAAPACAQQTQRLG